MSVTATWCLACGRRDFPHICRGLAEMLPQDILAITDVGAQATLNVTFIIESLRDGQTE